ncbi:MULTISPECIES: RNA polymerase sigma factor [unclassified Bacillus (in: firmicutes)]|uniref:RNA polymerase sigma factor n=1 Tax=unclassified Bacillus (in: firmicutes) TaxID=185979 RepID=UPI000BF13991|nr:MULTISPECIES: RNA polymerase sigma factor [unclassified Bacillus (in: firmicutes)]PEJ59963.1 hypothetical protein CN692_04060 [Bacillus sp. AFS002410]PEL14462.1 hypothetical protein CN601_00125 [Bacillus sp. AFS017336]
MGQTSSQQREILIDELDEFKQLFNEHKKHVFAMALSILRDFELSEDVLQEVFIKLFHQLNQNKISNIKAWLISVSRNTALDLYRKKKREITGFDDVFFERAQILSEDPLDKIVLTKYIEMLDFEERQIVIMKDFSGMKHKEIAIILEMPLGTVLWKYSKALKMLKKCLK